MTILSKPRYEARRYNRPDRYWLWDTFRQEWVFPTPANGVARTIGMRNAQTYNSLYEKSLATETPTDDKLLESLGGHE